MRVYSNKVIPGLLQTEGLRRRRWNRSSMSRPLRPMTLLGLWQSRMERRRVMHRSDARFVFLLEESVLWYRTTPPAVHAEQLRHLLSVMLMPSVLLAVIPRTSDRTSSGWGVSPEESFTMTDFAQVNVELVSGYLTVVQLDEIAMYVSAWERLFPSPLSASRLRLIRQAIEALPSE